MPKVAVLVDVGSIYPKMLVVDVDTLLHSLRPDSPTLYHDAGYIFYAMGLKAARAPSIAPPRLDKALIKHG